jgi:hypothetical protein
MTRLFAKVLTMTDKLLSILYLVNEWLKFAEAKNAVLLAFSGAAITAIVTYLAAAKPLTVLTAASLIISVLALCTSSLALSLSFIPKTDLDYLAWKRQKPYNVIRFSHKMEDNFYFYGSLRKYGPESLLEALNQCYFDNRIAKPYPKEDLDIASQIVVNSDITCRKFSFFRVSAWMLLLSIVTPLILCTLSLIIFRKL